MKKNIKSFFGILLAALAITSCTYDGIDPITEVDPGADASAPQITIKSPVEGATLKVVEAIGSINVQFEVVDDIEVENVTVAVDGNQIGEFSEFMDYRIVQEEILYDNVTNGEHTLTVTATDTEGNVTTKTVNFSKEPPYTPRFTGEVFYMPFDGDFMELVDIGTPEQIGTPGFADEAYLGTGAYLGATDSYLTIPLDDDLGNEFSAAFWYKPSGTPDRAGILVAGDDEADRNQGFRLFREGNADEQTIKLNVGTGAAESWNDGGKVPTGEWVHIAFTVSPTETVLYFNGVPVNTGTMNGDIDWTGVEELTIGAGGETFSYWDHLSDSSPMDELRMFDSALSQEDIQNLINSSSETLFIPFESEFKDIIANREITVVGDPGFTEGVEGNNAYAGAEGAYLTMPSAGLLSEEFSATFWYKVDASPDRAGIITIGPEDTENAGYPEVQNKRTSGLRLFREGNADEQRIKLNVGTGATDVWNDGGIIDVAAGEWVHVAFTISTSGTVIYLNGEPVNTSSLTTPIDWTGTDLVSIMSGAPRFTEWNHLSDQSSMDALKFYNKALTQEDVQASMGE